MSGQVEHVEHRVHHPSSFSCFRHRLFTVQSGYLPYTEPRDRSASATPSVVRDPASSARTLHGSYLHRCSPGTPTDQDSSQLGWTTYATQASAVRCSAVAHHGIACPTQHGRFLAMQCGAGALMRSLKWSTRGWLPPPRATRRIDRAAFPRYFLLIDATTQEQSTPSKHPLSAVAKP